MSYGLRLVRMRMANIPWRWLRLRPGCKPYLNRLLFKQAGFSLFISGRKTLFGGHIGVREPIALYIFPLSFLAFLIPMRPSTPCATNAHNRRGPHAPHAQHRERPARAALPRAERVGQLRPEHRLRRAGGA